MQPETIIGIVASTASAASMVPQLIKIIREKEAENISLVMLIVLLIGLCCWLWYGILKKDLIIIISNSISIILNVCIVVLSLKYKKKIQE